MPFINPGPGPLAQLGQTLNNASGLDARLRLQAAIQQQQLQRQAQQDARHAALWQAQSQHEASQTALAAAKTQAEQQKLAAALGFGQAVKQQRFGPPQVIAPERMGEAREGLDAAVLEKAAVLAGMGQQYVPENLAQLRQIGDPRAELLMATGAHPLQMVPAGGTALDAASQSPTYFSPRTMTPGSSLAAGDTGEVMSTAPGRTLPEYANRELQAIVNALDMFRGPLGDVREPIDPEQAKLFRALMAKVGPLAEQLGQPGAGTVLAPPPANPAQLPGTGARRRYNPATDQFE